MFIRIKAIKSKKGNIHFYFYKVQSEWVKSKKGARQRVVKYLGKATHLKGLTKKDIKKVLQKFNHKCGLCGSRDNITIDHIIPLSKGGTNNSWNLQVLCSKCNKRKGDLTNQVPDIPEDTSQREMDRSMHLAIREAIGQNRDLLEEGA